MSIINKFVVSGKEYNYTDMPSAKFREQPYNWRFKGDKNWHVASVYLRKKGDLVPYLQWLGAGQPHVEYGVK